MEKTISVVLVENHDISRMGLKAAFHQAGLVFLGEAICGKQGLDLLESAQPRVGVVNIDLPDMDGIELIRRFRDRFPNGPTRILVLTDDCSDQAVLAAFEAGASSFCTKAVDNAALISAIQATDAGQTWIDPSVANVVVSRARTIGGVTTSLSQKTIEIRAMESDYAQILKTYPLTDRELEILGCIVAGCSNAQISERLFVTVGTVKTHVRNILTKLGANDRTQAAVRALRSGLVS